VARPASDISQRIVVAARERFLLEGVDGASLRAIARDAGTNLGMVYYYYPSKDDLFMAVIEDVYAKLLEDLSCTIADASIDTPAKIARMYKRLGSISEDETKVVRLVLREGIGASSSRMGQVFERFQRGHVTMLGGMFAGASQRGELRGDLPPMVMVICTIFLGLFPQVIRRRLAEAGLPVDALIPPAGPLSDLLSSVLLHGISPHDSGALALRDETAQPSEKSAPPAASSGRASVDEPTKNPPSKENKAVTPRVSRPARK
jgi:AcrR family transcriptional regulator